MYKKKIMLLAIISHCLLRDFYPTDSLTAIKRLRAIRFHMQNYVVAVTSQAHAMIVAVQTTMQKLIIPVNTRSLLLLVAVLLMISITYTKNELFLLISLFLLITCLLPLWQKQLHSS